MKSNPPENGRTATGDEQYKRLGAGCPKKTRELPNVSECQACGFRVDACAGKARIRLLYSEWRVILLCKRCLFRVESSKICSYCFRDSSMEDCVRCGQCGRSLHTSCFQQYKTVPVCSCNSLPGKDFCICVDCWVPIPMARRRPVSKSERVCQHGLCLKLGDVNRGVGVHGKNVEPVKLKEMDLRNSIVEKSAVQVDHNVPDDSCESTQSKNLHPVVAVETDPLTLKPNLRVYEKSKSEYGRNLCNYNRSAKNPEEKLIDRNETSSARCLNVYARNRWRSGKYLWITNDCFTKVEATTTKGQESCSRRLMNVYARKRWKSGKVGEKKSCDFQKKEERQERGSINSICSEKFNVNSHDCNSRLAEPVVLIDEPKRFPIEPTKVYARARLKNSWCTQEYSGHNLNTGMQPDVVEGKSFHDTADSNLCDSAMDPVLRVCDTQGQS